MQKQVAFVGRVSIDAHGCRTWGAKTGAVASGGVFEAGIFNLVSGVSAGTEGGGAFDLYDLWPAIGGGVDEIYVGALTEYTHRLFLRNGNNVISTCYC